MKKIILSTIAILLVSFFSCKKKATTTANTSTTTTTTGGIVPSSGGDYCDLQTTYRYTNIGGTVTKDSMIFASFYAAPVSSVTPTYVVAGTVSLNGTNIPYMNPSYFIASNPPINISGTLNWDITGSGTVTAFSQSFTASYPKYAGGNVLPDTCIKANGITINVTGVSNNLNSVVVSLYCGSASATKYILSSNGTVSFSPSDLSSFPVNSSLSIIINLSNVYSATLGGIKRGFSNTLQYTKFSYLK